MRDLPFLLRRLFGEMMDPQRTLPLVIRARVYIAVRSKTHSYLWTVKKALSCCDQRKLCCEHFWFDAVDTQCNLHNQPHRYHSWRCFLVLFLVHSLSLYQLTLLSIFTKLFLDRLSGVLGVVGLLDDLLIALICFLHVAALYRSVLYFRHGGSWITVGWTKLLLWLFLLIFVVLTVRRVS